MIELTNDPDARRTPHPSRELVVGHRPRGGTGTQTAAWHRAMGASAGVLLLTREASLGLTLARLAESQHLSVTLCWSAADVERVPFWSFDAAIIDEEIWLEAQHTLSPRVLTALSRLPLVLLTHGGSHPSVTSAEATGAQRLARADGAALALEVAIRLMRGESAAGATGELAGMRTAQSALSVAIVEGNETFAEALRAGAIRRGLQARVYADVGQYREATGDKGADVVIVGFEAQSLRGVDLDAALAAVLGGTPGVVLGSDVVSGASISATSFVHLPRTASIDDIIDAAVIESTRAGL